LFDDGDILQGTPLGDLAAEAIIADRRAVNPVIAAMNTLDYAAATLGNHDFNYGLEALERAYAQARFPVVCCNVRKRDGSPWLPPSIAIERTFVDESETACRLKVGVIGVAPPQIAQWDEAHVRGRLTTIDIIEAVSAELAELRGESISLSCSVIRAFRGSPPLEGRRTRARTSPSSTALTHCSSAIST
jgi:2',3'-cyclic-nucleotide 2'-phosphodiesterase/3'-nucleotidase